MTFSGSGHPENENCPCSIFFMHFSLYNTSNKCISANTFRKFWWKTRVAFALHPSSACSIRMCGLRLGMWGWGWGPWPRYAHVKLWTRWYLAAWIGASCGPRLNKGEAAEVVATAAAAAVAEGGVTTLLACLLTPTGYIYTHIIYTRLAYLLSVYTHAWTWKHPDDINGKVDKSDWWRIRWWIRPLPIN